MLVAEIDDLLAFEPAEAGDAVVAAKADQAHRDTRLVPAPLEEPQRAAREHRGAARQRASSTTMRLEWMPQQLAQSLPSAATPRKAIAPGTFSST